MLRLHSRRARSLASADPQSPLVRSEFSSYPDYSVARFPPPSEDPTVCLYLRQCACVCVRFFSVLCLCLCSVCVPSRRSLGRIRTLAQELVAGHGRRRRIPQRRRLSSTPSAGEEGQAREEERRRGRGQQEAALHLQRVRALQEEEEQGTLCHRPSRPRAVSPRLAARIYERNTTISLRSCVYFVWVLT